MTVEHLIGKSQGGYLKQIKESVRQKFPKYSIPEIELISKKIDTINTVTACQFCNSTTSRDESQKSMSSLIFEETDNVDAILMNIKKECDKILKAKQEKVKWKLESVRTAFEDEVRPKLI